MDVLIKYIWKQSFNAPYKPPVVSNLFSLSLSHFVLNGVIIHLSESGLFY